MTQWTLPSTHPHNTVTGCHGNLQGANLTAETALSGDKGDTPHVRPVLMSYTDTLPDSNPIHIIVESSFSASEVM